MDEVHDLGVLREVLQQQAAMLQVQAETVRLQRVLVERLLSTSTPTTSAPRPAELPLPAGAEAVDTAAPAAVDRNVARGARYYLPHASPRGGHVAPEELELMRRLQEMREASDLILQFGPHKGLTLAQVAMGDPDYIRHLVSRAQRPEVRAAAGRLVQALDAAAEHKPRTTRPTSPRRGRSA